MHQAANYFGGQTGISRERDAIARVGRRPSGSLEDLGSAKLRVDLVGDLGAQVKALRDGS